jgi:hypothetical protein
MKIPAAPEVSEPSVTDPCDAPFLTQRIVVPSASIRITSVFTTLEVVTLSNFVYVPPTILKICSSVIYESAT